MDRNQRRKAEYESSDVDGDVDPSRTEPMATPVDDEPGVAASAESVNGEGPTTGTFDDGERGRLHGSLGRRSLLGAVGTALGALGFGGVSSAHDPWEVNPYADDWDSAHSDHISYASRRASDINWIVCHITEGGFWGSVNWFKDPNNPYNTSAHYVIRNSDGYCIQMVRDEDVAHHAKGFNTNSIGIEHEWYDGIGTSEVSDAAMEKSANIVEHVAAEYNIPLEYYTDPYEAVEADGGIIGHANAPRYGDPSDTSSKTCPQPAWNWSRYMDHLGVTGGGEPESWDRDFRPYDWVRVSDDVDYLNGRSDPDLDGDVVMQLEPGEKGKIYDKESPHWEDGIPWYLLYVRDRDDWAYFSGNYLELIQKFNGTYRIENVDSGKALNVGSGSTETGHNVHQWEWAGVDNQKWIIRPTGHGSWSEGFVYSIRAAHSFKSLEGDPPSDSGGNVEQGEELTGGKLDQDHSYDQKWYVHWDGDHGAHAITNQYDKCVQVDQNDDPQSDGGNVTLWTDYEDPHMRWTVRRLSHPGE